MRRFAEFSLASFQFWILTAISAGAFVIGSSSEAMALGKQDAYRELVAQGPKWRLTQTVAMDAESKLSESKAKTRPVLALGFTQMAARINPIQFGVDQRPLDVIGFGSTALEMRWALLDPIASFERLGAEAQLEISRSQTKQYQTDLTALMLFQYVTAQKLQAQLANMSVSANRSAEIFKLAKMKSGVGAGIPLDVARARGLSELDRIKQLQLQTKLSKALGDLALLLGRDALNDKIEDLRFDEIKAERIRELLARAPAQRGDLQSAVAAMSSSAKLAAKANSWFFPKFTILGDVGTTQPTWLGFPAERATGFLGVKLEIPIATGGLIDAKRQGAAALGLKAEAQEKITRLEMQNQIKESLEQMLAAGQAVSAAQDYVRAANEEAEIVGRKYKVGSGSIVDVVNASQNAATARDTEIDAVATYELAKIGLFKTAGSFDEYFKSEGSLKP